MVKVIANNHIKAGNLEKAYPLYEELVAETRKEPGCAGYDLLQDNQDAGHFVFVESWQTQEDLDKHMQSAHFTRILPQLDALSEKTGAVNLFTQKY